MCARRCVDISVSVCVCRFATNKTQAINTRNAELYIDSKICMQSICFRLSQNKTTSLLYTVQFVVSNWWILDFLIVAAFLPACQHRFPAVPCVSYVGWWCLCMLLIWLFKYVNHLLMFLCFYFLFFMFTCFPCGTNSFDVIDWWIPPFRMENHVCFTFRCYYTLSRATSDEWNILIGARDCWL